MTGWTPPPPGSATSVGASTGRGPNPPPAENSRTASSNAASMPSTVAVIVGGPHKADPVPAGAGRVHPCRTTPGNPDVWSRWWWVRKTFSTLAEAQARRDELSGGVDAGVHQVDRAVHHERQRGLRRRDDPARRARAGARRPPPASRCGPRRARVHRRRVQDRCRSMARRVGRGDAGHRCSTQSPPTSTRESA